LVLSPLTTGLDISLQVMTGFLSPEEKNKLKSQTHTVEAFPVNIIDEEDDDSLIPTGQTDICSCCSGSIKISSGIRYFCKEDHSLGPTGTILDEFHRGFIAVHAMKLAFDFSSSLVIMPRRCHPSKGV